MPPNTVVSLDRTLDTRAMAVRLALDMAHGQTTESRWILQRAKEIEQFILTGDAPK